MKFERTQEYENKLFEQALFDEKRVIKDAKIHIIAVNGKLKAYCEDSDTYLQFPRDMRQIDNRYVADVVEVKNDKVSEKYYRVVKGSIRKQGSEDVIS